ncbi:MAG: alpha-L-rhamnosidase-related protein [Candidatus Doudnabacteria bacterium]
MHVQNPEGSFQTGDTLLNKIWSVGVKTLRSCSEDALVDNLTRERGEWTGDVVSVGMDISDAAYSDLRLLRGGLIQSAECARSDGLVAGLSPVGTAYLLTYAAQWVSACIQYWELTGNIKLLDELYPYAEKDIEAFEKQTTS